MKHYIIRLRDTELWVHTHLNLSTYSSSYHISLGTDPLRVVRYDKYEAAEKVAEKHIPKGHWVIHKLTPQTELVGKPAEETFTVSETPVRLSDPVPVPVKVVEVSDSVVQRFINRRWFS